MKHTLEWIILAAFMAIFLFSSCTPQAIQPTLISTNTLVSPSTPLPTNRPLSTETATITATSTPDPFAKNRVPTELLASLPEVNNNKLIAFVNGHYEEYGTNRRDIYIMDFDGSNVKNLTNNSADDWGPVWSPDGKKILFFSDRNHCIGDTCELDLFVMNADGTRSRKLFQNLFSAVSLSWSPDLKQITFEHEFWDPRH